MTTNLLDRPMPPKVRQIILEVAKRHRLHPSRLLKYDSRPAVVRARHETYARILVGVEINHQPPSLPQIARWMNRSDHTSILHGLRRYASGFEWTRDQRSDRPPGCQEGVPYARILLAHRLSAERAA